MMRSFLRAARGTLVAGVLVLAVVGASGAFAAARKATAVFAGGCYWGVESVFRHVKGVTSAVSGFAVPAHARPESAVGHRDYVEAVRVEYDPTQVSYQQLLEIFFRVIHDPTQRDQQGPDVGPQYRSMVFVSDSAERQVVLTYIDRLTTTNAFPRPILTELDALKRFQEAGPDQQDYAAKHPGEPYIIINDAPKLDLLRQGYPGLFHP